MRRISCVFLLSLAALPAAPAAAAQEGARPAIVIERAASAPRLEDYLNGESGPGTRVQGFLQREPGDLTPSTEQTTAYLSYDREHLYVVFVCRAADPSRIRARMTRRESVFEDDHVAVFLDTFNDQRRSYMFIVTPMGIQADGISTEGQHDDMSFDTVWQSRAERTPFGYVAALTIPFKSLRFAAGSAPQTWGLALGRSIPSADELSFWPGITRRISGFAEQMAEASGIEGVSPGRNIQLIPYGSFTAARFLDRPGARYARDRDARVGIDAKVVARDAIAFDFTLNPDFSQVESDEPQVTANQRFEVFFPERRPFFIENAGYFQTPINLFFSRRLSDPQFGTRATGKLGGWALGALVADDRGPGQALAPGDPLFGDRAYNIVGRARREFANQSSVGGLVTSRDFGASSNRVAAADARVRLNAQWSLDAQAAFSATTDADGSELSDAAYSALLGGNGRSFSYSLFYEDIGRDFRTQLGFVPRTDTRLVNQFASYRWRPSRGPVRAFGPNTFYTAIWNHEGELQEWLLRFPFAVDFRGQTGLFLRRAEGMTRFGGIEFREHENYVNFNTSYLSWLSAGLTYADGARPNFFPAPGVAPFIGSFRDVALSVTLRPLPSLLVDQTYIFSHLGAREDSGHAGRVFDNHILRTRVNYQFTREFSARAIVDYNGIWANASLVTLDPHRALTTDVLFTYLLHPGTAVYIGFTDGYQNVALDDPAGLRITRRPTTSTGRQIFVKTSYLLKF